MPDRTFTGARGLWTPWGMVEIDDNSTGPAWWPYEFHPLWCVIGVMYCYIAYKLSMMTAAPTAESSGEESTPALPAGPPPASRKAENAAEKIVVERSVAEKKKD